MSENTHQRMPMVDLEKTQEYLRLTPKQKMFIQTYCCSGAVDGQYDAVAATNAAYKCKSDEVARVMSYSLLANINIIAVLNRHFGTEPIDSFLKNLDRAVHNKSLTLAQLGALQLQCQVLGFATKLPTNIGHAGPFAAPDPRDAKKPRKTPKTPKSDAVAPAPPVVPYDRSRFE